MAERDIIETKGRRARDRSAVLLVVGILFLMPPFAGVALIDGFIFGIPITLFYVFAVWAGLIVLGAILAKPLSAFDRTPSEPSMREHQPPDGS